MSRESDERALEFYESNFKNRVTGSLGAALVRVLSLITQDWWDSEGVSPGDQILEDVSIVFESLEEEDYLAERVIPEPLSTPPEITDPVISDILLPVRDEEEWKRDCELMDTLKKMSVDPMSSARMRSDTARLYELALAGWSYTFYRKGE